MNYDLVYFTFTASDCIKADDGDVYESPTYNFEALTFIEYKKIKDLKNGNINAVANPVLFYPYNVKNVNVEKAIPVNKLNLPLPKIGTPINFIDIFAHANIPAIIEARIHYPLKPSSMWIIEERENCDCSACKYREENKEPIFISCDENGNYLSPSQMKKIKNKLTHSNIPNVKELDYKTFYEKFKNTIPDTDKYKEYKLDLIIYKYVLKGFVASNAGTEEFINNVKNALEFIEILENYNSFELGEIIISEKQISNIHEWLNYSDEIKEYIDKYKEFNELYYKVDGNDEDKIYCYLVKHELEDTSKNEDMQKVLNNL